MMGAITRWASLPHYKHTSLLWMSNINITAHCDRDKIVSALQTQHIPNNLVPVLTSHTRTNIASSKCIVFHNVRSL